MRLFVFNNGKLKYVLRAKYNNQPNLAGVFESTITSDIINKANSQGSGPAVERKKQLWATAFIAMKKIVFKGSNDLFLNERNIPGGSSTARPVGTTTAYYDFYLDRGTGWCALIRNYSIYRESNKDGNIENKGTLISKNEPLAWKLFPGKYFGVDNTATNFANQVIAGTTSIIPFSAGNFYEPAIPMLKNNFSGLNRLVSRVTNTVWAIVAVEWPVVVFDKSYTDWPGFVPSEALNKYNTLISKQVKDLNESSSQPNKPAGADYLVKLKDVNQYLTIIYREIRMLSTCRNFDSDDIRLSFGQNFLFYACKLLGAASSIFSFTSINIDGVTTSIGAGALSKQLFDAAANYLKGDQALNGLRGHPSTVQDVFNRIEITVTLAMATYYLFLLEFGLSEIVTGMKDQELVVKIKKVILFMQKKKISNDGLLDAFFEDADSSNNVKLQLQVENETLQQQKGKLAADSQEIKKLRERNEILKAEIEKLKNPAAKDK